MASRKPSKVGGGTTFEPFILKPVEIKTDGSQKIVVLNKTDDEFWQAVANGTPCYVGFDATAVCDASSVEDLYPRMCPMLDDAQFVYYDGLSGTMEIGVLTTRRSDNAYVYMSECSGGV